MLTEVHALHLKGLERRDKGNREFYRPYGVQDNKPSPQEFAKVWEGRRALHDAEGVLAREAQEGDGQADERVDGEADQDGPHVHAQGLHTRAHR